MYPAVFSLMLLGNNVVTGIGRWEDFWHYLRWGDRYAAVHTCTVEEVRRSKIFGFPAGTEITCGDGQEFCLALQGGMEGGRTILGREEAG